MSKIKWFSGGNERGDQALSIIYNLLEDEELSSYIYLRTTLKQYEMEFKQKSSSVPFILSRMNLDLSKALRNDGVPLKEDQNNKLKQLAALSNIRYGY